MKAPRGTIPANYLPQPTVGGACMQNSDPEGKSRETENMRTVVKLVLTVLMVYFSLACEVAPYEIHEDKLGRHIRLNRWTGAIAIVEGDTVIELGRSVTYAGPLSREWPPLTLTQLGDVNATLKTAWHDGRVRFQFSLSPESKKLKEARTESFGVGKSFTVMLTDLFGIAVVQDDVPFTSMSRIVDEKGATTGLSYTSQVACSYTDYLLVAGWNVLRRL